MKKKVLLLILNISLFNACHGQLVKNEDLHFFYLGYSISTFNNEVKNNAYLNILINNIGNDTLYLSKSNIRVIIKKDNKNIKDNNYNGDANNKNSYQPFIPPSFPSKYKSEEKEKYLIMKDSLINIYSNKLFEKNLKKNQLINRYKENILKKIKEDCIVILPKETYEYNYLVKSKKINRESKIEISYDSKNIFSTIEYDNKVFKIQL
ncbi:hypothetical protein K5I29_03575 [Flavobacterium agricola]|uniref:Lipoprotein n=1 Tax=Flavobacterium agricola TaxID=2870839 RepID=A0ABY6M4D0_9FLAO|nr:hypothetical protein [Flavobacterium agricola]UYW02003.1 hypothetical protein K5I29_03575 [Flavobacterium agricola]